MRRLAIALLLVCPPLARASDVSANDPPTAGLAPASPSAPSEVSLGPSRHLTAGIGWNGPIGAAASLRFVRGLGADVRDEGGRVDVVCAVPISYCAGGFLLQADAGSGGGKLSLGIGGRARIEDADFHGTLGTSFRMVLARTWGAPVGTEAGLTYLGPEVDLAILRVNLTLGVLRRVSGRGGAATLFSWGLGIGL